MRVIGERQAQIRSRRSRWRCRTPTAADRTEDNLPVHSLRTLLLDLATVTLNVTSTAINPQAKIIVTTRPTPLQAKAFALLGVDPECSQ